MDKLKKIDKEKLIILAIIFVAVVVYVGKLFPVNYPSDIYHIRLLGLKTYAYKWFLPSGRFVGVAALYLLDFLNVSIDGYITIMKVLSFFISTACIYLFYTMLTGLKETPTRPFRIMLLAATLLLFLNNGTYQYYYYPESAVMWLSMLFVILALRMSLSDKKIKYLWIFVFLFIATNCYQAVVYFYLPALLLIQYIKKRDFKEAFIELFKNALIVGVNLIIGFFIVKIARNSFDVIVYKPLDIKIDLEAIWDDIIFILFAAHDGARNFIILIINWAILFTILFIKEKYIQIQNQSYLFLTALLIMLISFLEVLATISFLNFYLGDRIQFAYIVSCFLNIILVLLSVKIENKKVIYCITAGLIIGVILYMINSYDITINSFKAIELSKQIADTYKSRIEEYEKENNIVVKKIVYCFDNKVKLIDEGIRNTYEPTARRLGDWTIDAALQYYLDRDIEVTLDKDIQEKYFKDKNWTCYNDEQLKFVDDTLYLCIY